MAGAHDGRRVPEGLRCPDLEHVPSFAPDTLQYVKLYDLVQ